MKRLRVVAALLALFAGACGGEQEGRPEAPPVCRPIEPLSDTDDTGGGPVDCHALDGYELFVLNTFESGAEGSAWYFNSDRTAVTEPPPDSNPGPGKDIPFGRCVGVEPSTDHPQSCSAAEIALGECDVNGEPALMESRRAMNIRSGYLSGNGGVFGHITSKICPPVDESTECPFLPGPPEVGPCEGKQLYPDEDEGRADDPHVGMAPTPPRRGCRAQKDTSGWEGIVFWARVGPGSNTTVRLRASDERTDDKACICNPYTNQNDSSDGCDKFGKYVNLDGTWRAHFVPFREMQQGGWGLNSPGLDTSNLFEIVFEYGRGAWDLWIDDVAYYRRKP